MNLRKCRCWCYAHRSRYEPLAPAGRRRRYARLPERIRGEFPWIDTLVSAPTVLKLLAMLSAVIRPPPASGEDKLMVLVAAYEFQAASLASRNGCTSVPQRPAARRILGERSGGGVA